MQFLTLNISCFFYENIDSVHLTNTRQCDTCNLPRMHPPARLRVAVSRIPEIFRTTWNPSSLGVFSDSSRLFSLFFSLPLSLPHSPSHTFSLSLSRENYEISQHVSRIMHAGAHPGWCGYANAYMRELVRACFTFRHTLALSSLLARIRERTRARRLAKI